MHVVPATPADIPRLCELLGILFAQEAEFSPNRENQERGLGMIIANPSIGTILVLKDGDEIVGMVSLLYTVSTFLGAKVAMVEDVIVAPSHRGKGAGTELLQGAIDYATQQGCQRPDGADRPGQCTSPPTLPEGGICAVGNDSLPAHPAFVAAAVRRGMLGIHRLTAAATKF